MRCPAEHRWAFSDHIDLYLLAGAAAKEGRRGDKSAMLGHCAPTADRRQPDPDRRPTGIWPPSWGFHRPSWPWPGYSPGPESPLPCSAPAPSAS